MAGLTAARSLAEAGRSVVLLEASSRVGGRIFTARHNGEPIELGAEFIHGRPPELWSLLEEANLQTWELTGPALTWHSGHLQPFDEEDSATSLLEPLESTPGNQPDLTFAEYLDRQHLPEPLRRSAIGYVEGFNAADYRVISTSALGLQQAAEDAIEGDRIFRIHGGYDQLPEHLCQRFRAAGGTLHTSTLLERVEWVPGHVTLLATQAGQPARFEAEQAVIALPLGVLHQHAVEFLPVPDPVREAQRLRMGQVSRFTLLFRERFWTNPATPNPSRSPLPGNFSFLFSFGMVPPVWWTPLPHPAPTITGWTGGPRSEALLGLSAQELGDLACEHLAMLLGLPLDDVRAQLVQCFTHDWRHDALFAGSYSYVPTGALDACSKMTLPADHTLFFAGEHTDITGHWGTVHAAIRSGLRAAQQILAS